MKPEHLLDKIRNKLFIANVRKTDDYIELVKEMKDLDGHCPYYVLYPFITNLKASLNELRYL